MAERTALYRLYDNAGTLLYVGAAKDPSRRFRDHRAEKSWWHEVAQDSVEWFETPFHALKAEVEAIKREAPRYNIRSTEAHNLEKSATARSLSSEARRRRGVGVSARALQVRTLRRLLSEGVPRGEAERQALLAKEAFKAASGLFDDQRAA